MQPETFSQKAKPIIKIILFLSILLTHMPSNANAPQIMINRNAYQLTHIIITGINTFCCGEVVLFVEFFLVLGVGRVVFDA